MGYPGRSGSHITFLQSQNVGVDPTIIVVVIVIGMPLAVVWALVRSSQLRGPLRRADSRRPVQTLVTEAVPEDPPADPDDEEPETASR
jgi:hypothetical protein